MDQYIWDDNNLGKLARHLVTQVEVEFVLSNPTLDLGYQEWHDEERFSEVGATSEGRVLLVVTTWRGIRTRVITAYDAPGRSTLTRERPYEDLAKFKDEAEEAEWWFVHRDEIAEDMIQASRSGTLGEGTAARRARKLKEFEAKQSGQSAA